MKLEHNISELSDECEEYKSVAHKFAREEIIPRAAHYDQTGEVIFLCNLGCNLSGIDTLAIIDGFFLHATTMLRILCKAIL